MEIVEITGHTARCRAKGVERDVSLFLMQSEPLTPGDFVMVHVGYAIQKIARTDARSAWEIYDRMTASDAAAAAVEAPDA